jgi:hypothetical protein
MGLFSSRPVVRLGPRCRTEQDGSEISACKQSLQTQYLFNAPNDWTKVCLYNLHPIDPSRAAAHAVVLSRQVIVEFETMAAAAAASSLSSLARLAPRCSLTNVSVSGKAQVRASGKRTRLVSGSTS